MCSATVEGRVEFRLLGPFEVVRGGQALPIASTQQRSLLAMTVLSLNRVVPLSAMVTELWGDTHPPSAESTVRGLLSRLRGRLGADPGTAGIALRSRAHGYVLEADPDQVDASCFQRLTDQGRQAGAGGDHEEAADKLGAALALWRGPALGDLADRDFARLEAMRFDETHRGAVEDLAESELELGRPQDALSRLQPHVQAHPLRERPWGQIMIALYRLGRQAEALRAYQQLRRALGQELGIEPNPELRRLEVQILEQDAALDGPKRTHQRPPGAQRPQLRQSNLPVALTPFVGRTQEIAELTAFIARSRLVTLTGIGGTGKTRLAVEVAALAVDAFDDGVTFVELASLRDPSLVAAQAATALALQPGVVHGPTALQQWICEHLRSQRLLVLLDNCEHVVDEAARFAYALLTQCPGVRVLATSREVLGVAGEVVWPVPPLNLPPETAATVSELSASDAVRLFCERAQAAEPSFRLTPANADRVARICRRLDGLPLAVELAAAQARTLGPAQIAERLDDCFRLLTSGHRTALPRQQTLRATMDWSYQLLSASEQAVLRQLAVFPASFDLSAAGAVAGPDVLEALSRLVDKSLIDVRRGLSGVRYRLLETVRQYAHQHLVAAGEAGAAHRAHRDCFLALARTWQDDAHWWDVGDLPRRVSADEDSFRAALALSLERDDEEPALCLSAALWMHWLYVGRAEGVAWLERALAGPDRLAVPARVEALVGLGSLLDNADSGDPDRPGQLFGDAVALAERIGDAAGAARARFHLAQHTLARGNTAAARSLLTVALADCEENGVPGTGWCHYELGWATLADGDLAGARDHWQTALQLVGTGELHIPHALAALAPLSAVCGDAERARVQADEAVRTAREFCLPTVVTMALCRAAETRIVLADTEEAEVILAELLNLLKHLGARRFVADALEMSALLCQGAGRAAAAARLLGAAANLREIRAEVAGGVRALTPKVLDCRDRLTEKLEGDYSKETDRGAAMPVTEALNFALAELTDYGFRPSAS